MQSLAGGGRREIWPSIRDSVRAKGGRYGKLDSGYIVAVNVDRLRLNQRDEMQALFDQEDNILVSDFDHEPEMRRTRNGAWVGPKGPQYKRVSGVWIFDRLDAWHFVRRRSTLYLNPWAQFTLPSEFRILPHAEVIDGKVEWRDGISLGQLLKLEASWPE